MLKEMIIIASALALVSGCKGEMKGAKGKRDFRRSSAYAPKRAEETGGAMGAVAGPRPQHGRATGPRRFAKRSRTSGLALPATAVGGALSRVSGTRAARRRRPVVVLKKNTEQYTSYGVNPFVDARKDPRSTFGVDVDTASYTICRRKLRSGTRPPASAVRVEEFVNYFNYGYRAPASEPFLVHIDGAPSPFEAGHYFLRVGIQGKRLDKAARKPVHLTFLVDTSGSMHSADKLPLAKRAMRILINQLKKGDTVAIATYAGAVRKVLPPTGIDGRAQIEDAIYSLASGGGTAMNDGMKLAYRMAAKSLVKGHVNRVIVLSDGDANIGRTGWRAMLGEIKSHADKGITMSTIGFGMGNYKDTRMEQLANKGNGNYYYIDSLSEARKIFAKQVVGTLQVIAKDVKVQVIFNPAMVARHRLLGYENRKLAHRDFDNDKVDAGELGAGHTVTAIYEIVLRKAGRPTASAKGLAAFRGKQDMLALVRLRHKPPQTAAGARSRLIEGYFPRRLLADSMKKASKPFQLALAVAALGEKLRGSRYAKEWTFATITQLAERGVDTKDPSQVELLSLLKKAASLSI